MAMPHAGILVLPHDAAAPSAERLSTFARALTSSIEGQVYLYKDPPRGWELLPLL